MAGSDISCIEPGPGAPALSLAPPAVSRPASEDRLVRRVNQLYHDLVHEEFDDQHRMRHKVEQVFWNRVGHVLRLRPGSGRVVLDLACGTGFVTRVLSGFLEASDRLIGLDLSTGALREAGGDRGASARAECSVQFCAADVARLPLGDGSVDLVAINAALHHFPRPDAVLREVDRVLRPGGRFALGFEPNRAHFDSAVLPAVASRLSLAGWYLSPRENRRRICGMLRRATGGASASSPAVLAINRELISEGLVDTPICESALLDLVDPHARGSEYTAGFDPSTLLATALPAYRLEFLMTSDYLGEAMRRVPAVRASVDAALRCIVPRHGSLFSWLVRKPCEGESLK